MKKRENARGGGVANLEMERFTPEDFLTANQRVAEQSLEILQKLYDWAKSSENKDAVDDPLGLHTTTLKASRSELKRIRKLRKQKTKKSHGSMSIAEAPLVSLITDGFDEGQIWEEVELQNGLLYDNLVTSVSKLLAYQQRPLGGREDRLSEGDEGRRDEGPPPLSGEEEEDSDFFESDEKYRKKRRGEAEQKHYPKSVVDDPFFSLAQMHEHMEQLEAEEADHRGKGEQHKTSDDDDDDSIDFFEDIPDEQNEDDSEKQEGQYFYQDFFDPPFSGNDPSNPNEIPIFPRRGQEEENLEDSEDEEEDEEEPIHGSAPLNLESEEEEDDSHDDESPESKTELNLVQKINQTLSTFEKRKKKIEESIEEAEQEALQPKSWHLLGEATAQSRPENALLEEHMTYDHLIRPAPEITVVTTLKLEDVIKQRIKDRAWDDVIRKVRPVEDPREYKKRLVLDAEKSKASLTEIYEQEYLNQKRAEEGEREEKEPEEHKHIRKEMQTLFEKLDALSHFHFTPKPPKADVKILVNMPSVSIEETAGVNVSDANMLAPQEIEGQAKGAIKGMEEKSATDRKRERRKKKKKQHLQRLMQDDKLRQKGLGLSNIKLAEGIVKAQQKKMKAAESSSSGGGFRYSTSNQNTKELKSSKAFFSKLQESVTTHIEKVAKRKKSVEKEKSMSAKRFKL